MELETTQGRYAVVANHEEQYSIWEAGRDLPPGWSEVDKRGTKEECLDYIRQVWTDMRPKSLRNHLGQAGPASTGSQTGVSATDRV